MIFHAYETVKKTYRLKCHELTDFMFAFGTCAVFCTVAAVKLIVLACIIYLEYRHSNS